MLCLWCLLYQKKKFVFRLPCFVLMFMLQVKSNPRSICSNLHVGQFDFLFCFCGKQNLHFLATSISFHALSSLHLHPLYLPQLLFPPCSPNIPACILFISMLTLWALNHRPLVKFLWIHVLMPYQWAMKTWMQVPLFFKLHIHFLKLFKSGILMKENIPPIIITLASIVAYYPGSNEHFGGL